MNNPGNNIPGEQKFSAFLTWTLIALLGISLTLVMGVLYIILSRTMTNEFYNKLEAERTKVSMELQDRFNQLEKKLRDMGANNALRVSLMLGMDNQLRETITEQYSPSRGSFFLIKKAGKDSGFTPDIPERLTPVKNHLLSMPEKDHILSQQFQEVGEGRFISVYSLPVQGRNKRLGTAFAIYTLSRDTGFWKKINPAHKSHLCLWDEGRPVNMRTQKTMQLPQDFSRSSFSGKDTFQTIPGSAWTLLPFKKFPHLVYLASSAELQKEKRFLIFILGTLTAAVFLLTLVASIFIVRRMSKPLGNMAEQAMQIAREPSGYYLQEEKIHYLEFRKLAKAFNQVLSGLFEAQEELKKQAQKELDASEMRYQNLVETSPAGIFYMDLQERILFANHTLEIMTGYSENELKVLTYQALQHSEEVDNPPEENMIKWSHKGAQEKREAQWICKNGEKIWVELRAARIREKEKEAILVNAMDITERKSAEKAVRQSEEKYRSVINQSTDYIYMFSPGSKQVTEANPAMLDLLGYTREEMLSLKVDDFIAGETREEFNQKIESIRREGHFFLSDRLLQKKNGDRVHVESRANVIAYGGRELISVVCRDLSERKRIEEERLKRQKLESIGILAGGLAHDFNNLLTGIIGNLSLAQKHTRSEDNISTLLEKTEKACFNARDIAQQLLTFSQGGAPLVDVVSMSELLNDTATFSLRGSNIVARFSIQEDLWEAEVDATQISQVIDNLVINARDAMSEGGTVFIRARNLIPDEAHGASLSPGRYIQICIEDEGDGVSEESLSRIFDPYFTTKETGNGLGLAMVHSIIEKHGGQIHVQSTPEVGTAFYIYLPASGKSRENLDRKKVENLPAGQGKILVMDDEEVVLDVAEDALTHLGYEATLVATGDKAVETYQEAMQTGDGFDAVILDLTVRGGMGGEEAIRELLRIDPSVRAIVSSGYSHDPIMANYREYGFADILSKPYKVDNLAQVLARVLNSPSQTNSTD